MTTMFGGEDEDSLSGDVDLVDDAVIANPQ